MRSKPSAMTVEQTGKHGFFFFRSYMKTPTLLIAGMLLVCILALGECRYEPVEVMLDEFDFYNTHSYDPLYGIFFDVLNSTVPRFAYAGHVYLGIKDCVPYGSPPARWIKLPVRGETEQDRATLAFSDNDLYLRAFQNNEGTWHVFKGYEHMFPGAIVINSPYLDETYVKLVGGHQNLYLIPLGRDAALSAARTLGRYRYGTTPEAEVKIALVQFMIMISEALRFRVIREHFSYRWETESHLTVFHTKCVVQWTDLSKLLYIYEKDNVWDISKGTGKKVFEAIGISNANQAEEIVDFLRRPKPLRAPDF